MYQTNTRPLEEREELVKNAREASKLEERETYPFYEFQNTLHNLPIIRLEIGVLVYRMLNYRTRTAQLQYIHDREKSKDFFETGQENEEAQQAQHDLLVGYAKRGREGSVVPIFEELQKQEQREPIIITTSGVVVNGNRRLAAMRELFTDNPDIFPHFSHANCAVLPGSATPEEIRETEVRLQMQSETKLPYEWINECLAIKELSSSNKSYEYIASLMNKKERDVKIADQALSEVDMYLREWVGTPGEYEIVEGGEQYFKELVKGLDKKQGNQLEIRRRFAWALFGHKNLRTRAYDYKFSFNNHTDEIVNSLANRLDVDLTPQDKTDTGGEDDLEISIEDGNETTSFTPLIDLFNDKSKRETVANELVAACNNFMDIARQGEIGKRALEAIKSANSKLQEVDFSKADPSTYRAIGSQLDNVIKQAKKLKKELNPYKSN